MLLLAQTWNKALVSKGVETLDVTSEVSELLAVKDEVEQSNSKKAAQFTSKVLKEFLVAQIENVIGMFGFVLFLNVCSWIHFGHPCPSNQC